MHASGNSLKAERVRGIGRTSAERLSESTTVPKLNLGPSGDTTKGHAKGAPLILRNSTTHQRGLDLRCARGLAGYLGWLIRAGELKNLSKCDYLSQRVAWQSRRRSLALYTCTPC
eukprot:4051140-Amphidinium_carterae.1